MGQLIELITAMLAVDHRERIDAAQALNYDFLTVQNGAKPMQFKVENIRRIKLLWLTAQLKDNIKDYASFMGSAHYIAAAFE